MNNKTRQALTTAKNSLWWIQH